jgi:hypothetical protein
VSYLFFHFFFSLSDLRGWKAASIHHGGSASMGVWGLAPSFLSVSYRIRCRGIPTSINVPQAICYTRGRSTLILVHMRDTVLLFLFFAVLTVTHRPPF